jgi:hypothetical protein
MGSRYSSRVVLPITALRRAVAPLKGAGNLARPLRAHHSLPVPADQWNRATEGIHGYVSSAVALSAELGTERSFEELTNVVEQFLAHRERAASILFSLEPFEYFDGEAASRLLELLDRGRASLALQLEEGRADRELWDELSALAEYWRRPVEDPPGDRTQRAFGVDRPLVDEKGAFHADWVLQHYAYRGDVLFRLLMPHLTSLGPGVSDLLAGVSIVGWSVSSPDPILAYVAFDAFAKRFAGAKGAKGDKAIRRLQDREPARRRTQDGIGRLWEQVSAAGDSRSLLQSLVADLYVREVEGPFRQFVWAAHSMSAEVPDEVPTLGSFRDAVVAVGGALAKMVADVVMLDFRNSATHETLEWDGLTDEFVTESGRRIPLDEVVIRALMARSAAWGCEAAMTALNALGVADDSSVLPEPKQMHRMPDWRRARAYFGTNRLKLLDAELHVRSASMTVERLDMGDVNPCFQAILLSSTLIPAIEMFTVTARGYPDSQIDVARSAIEATRPVWQYSVSNLDMMPLSAFLPMNLDARAKHEDGPTAVRSVAWIAADDVLGILDGSPDVWDALTIELMTVRLEVAFCAISATLVFLDRAEPRLDSVRESVRDFRAWIGSNPSPTRGRANRLASVLRLRRQWDTWGPVQRHPSVPDVEPGDATERQPGLRQPPTTPHFTTF